MTDNKINFIVPAGWYELSDRQLRYVYQLYAADFTDDEIKLLCLLRWSKTKVVGRQRGGNYLLKQGKAMFEVSATAVAEILPMLDWLAKYPSYPVRPSKIGLRKALAADFDVVPFETYIIVDNLYQGFLKTQDEALLDELAAVLYPRPKWWPSLFTLRSSLSAHNRIAIFFWVAALKDFLALRYPSFFQPAGAAKDDGNLLGTPERGVEDAMNAQIRALTKGDVTKEAEILALDTWRALTELNAQAKEYKEFNDKYGKQS